MESTPHGYEFTAEENENFSVLVDRMGKFSWALLLGGPLVSGLSFYSDVVLRFAIATENVNVAPPVFMMSFMAGLVVTVLGIWLRSSLAAFKKIVTTEGSDLNHLMAAIHQLRLFFQYGAAMGWTLILILFMILGFYALRPAGTNVPANGTDLIETL
jgi:hypothetical protein